MAAEDPTTNSNVTRSGRKIEIAYQDGNRWRFAPPSHVRAARICRFYVKGTCRFGDRCWYIHSEGSEANDLSNDPEQKPNATSDWINAPEFIPRAVGSYADALNRNLNREVSGEQLSPQLCPFFEVGDCPFDRRCRYVHGDLCELCGKACMNPYDVNQRKAHTEFCERELEEDMELSFAIQRSRDKTCGICMDVVYEKDLASERRFGVMEKCNHVFCLDCIRKWRKTKSEQNANQADVSFRPVAVRGCPECRVPSDFVTPSQFWMDSKADKEKLISDYKLSLSKRPCRYFKQGEGNCPFGGECFYVL